MRTTLVLDDDVYEAAQARARVAGISLGKAVSEIARAALGGVDLMINENGYPVLSAPGAARIDSPQVKEILLESEGDEALRVARR